MKKVKFIKTRYKTVKGIWIFLDDSLFKTENDKISKTIEILKIFSSNMKRYAGDVFIIKKNKNIINKLHNLKKHYELIGTYKHLFNNIEEKNKMIFNNEQITEFVHFIIINDLTFSGKGDNSNNQILLEIAMNDHEGSYIFFNNEFYELDKLNN